MFKSNGSITPALKCEEVLVCTQFGVGTSMGSLKVPGLAQERPGPGHGHWGHCSTPGDPEQDDA